MYAGESFCRSGAGCRACDVCVRPYESSHLWNMVPSDPIDYSQCHYVSGYYNQVYTGTILTHSLQVTRKDDEVTIVVTPNVTLCPTTAAAAATQKTASVPQGNDDGWLVTHFRIVHGRQRHFLLESIQTTPTAAAAAAAATRRFEVVLVLHCHCHVQESHRVSFIIIPSLPTGGMPSSSSNNINRTRSTVA